MVCLIKNSTLNLLKIKLFSFFIKKIVRIPLMESYQKSIGYTDTFVYKKAFYLILKDLDENKCLNFLKKFLK
jgi:hypothetical protein